MGAIRCSFSSLHLFSVGFPPPHIYQMQNGLCLSDPHHFWLYVFLLWLFVGLWGGWMREPDLFVYVCGGDLCFDLIYFDSKSFRAFNAIHAGGLTLKFAHTTHKRSSFSNLINTLSQTQKWRINYRWVSGLMGQFAAFLEPTAQFILICKSFSPLSET